jgi:hypothetical protein
MAFSRRERIRRYLRLARRAEARGQSRQADLFRRMARDLSIPTP